MIRAPWSHLARSGFRSLLQRLAVRRSRALRRARNVYFNEPAYVQVEKLEERILLTPVANNDSYSVAHDQTVAPSSGSGVLANDFIYGGGGTLSATLVSGPSHGTLNSFNSDGTFGFTAAHYIGTDSFTYKDSDGLGNWSSVATVTLTITNAAPSANAYSFTTYRDSYNSTSEGAATLLAGNSDANGDTMTASLVTAPSHGTVTVNSDGTYLYTRTSGYVGSDSFVYGVSDPFTTTNGTVSITDASPFSAQTNAPDQPFAGIIAQGAFSTSQLTGEAQTAFDLGHGHSLVYSSLTADVMPIVAVEAQVGTSTIAVPDSIEMHMTFGGLTANTLYFSTTGITALDKVRFADQLDASSLATGHYQYQVTLIGHYGSATSTRVFTGYQDIVNRQSSEFGPGWTLAELDKLAIGTGGVLWAGGAGGAAWFTDTGGGTYSSPAGPMAFSTLAKSGSVYTLTDKFGNVSNFDSAGFLTSKVDVNGNSTGYAYSSGKLSTITDPFGRTTTFSLTSGLVTSISDIASKTTSLAYTSGNLTSITAPDPDGAGSLTSPVTAYAYGSAHRISSITDPLSHVTSLTYGFAGRLSGATFADSSTNSFTPTEMAGVVNTSGGTGLSSGSPAAPYVISYIPSSSFTDALSHTVSATYDVFGDLLSYSDALGFVTTYVRNANGQVTQLTQPDPDGAGSLVAPVTSYTYDSKGNVTQIAYPDSSYETWTYNSTFNKPLTHVDQLGHTTTYTLDSHGNTLTVTDRLGNVTTLVYNSHGQPTSITGADPDAGGPLSAPVTSFTYDTSGRVTRVTNPDTTVVLPEIMA